MINNIEYDNEFIEKETNYCEYCDYRKLIHCKS